jgi:hypothetical protein
MQKIENPTIFSSDGAFWNAYPADYLPYRRYRRKGFIGQSQQNCFVHFIEIIIFGR